MEPMPRRANAGGRPGSTPTAGPGSDHGTGELVDPLDGAGRAEGPGAGSADRRGGGGGPPGPGLRNVVVAHIPFLRRFARSLSGDQRTGDAQVERLLDDLIGSGGPAEDLLRAPKVALYRRLLATWRPTLHAIDADPPNRSGHDRRLVALPPRERQAFLLVHVEGFSVAEAAAVLSVSPAQVGDLLTEAGAAMARQVATDVLIIEDEPLIAMDLKALVTDLGHTVTAIARTRTAAIEEAHRRRPGLILADIKLADGSSGLDAVEDILAAFCAPVVFVTAYPERLLTGRRVEPVFLITKPYDVDHVRAVVSQALFFDHETALAPAVPHG